MNGGAHHPSLHTDDYYMEVTRRLELATTREEAIEFLQEIADELTPRGK